MELEGFDEWDIRERLESQKGDSPPIFWGEREIAWPRLPSKSDIPIAEIFDASLTGNSCIHFFQNPKFDCGIERSSEPFSDKFRRIGFGFGLPSVRLSTLGTSDPDMLILGINGINVSKSDALSHQAYLHHLTKERAPIDFIYNRSNRFLTDLGEVFFLNYFGISPFTAKLLQTTWQAFAEQNKENPEKKILQFCHSQAAIHVYNALVDSPYRDRVIVISIAPAKVIPNSICHASFNYASKLDVVHYGELIFASAVDLGSHGLSTFLKKALENREQLILLDPDPEATGMDHDFQSSTFKDVLQGHLEDYIQRKGSYFSTRMS